MRLTKFTTIILVGYIIFTNVIIWRFVAFPFFTVSPPSGMNGRSVLAETVGVGIVLVAVALFLVARRIRSATIVERIQRAIFGVLFVGLLAFTSVYFALAHQSCEAAVRRLWLSQGVGMLNVAWIVLAYIIMQAHESAEAAAHSSARPAIDLSFKTRSRQRTVDTGAALNTKNNAEMK